MAGCDRRGGGGEGGSGRRTVPLACDLVSRVAVAPWVVVDGVFGVHLHVFFAGAAAVEVRDRSDDFFVRGGDFEGVFWVRGVVDAGAGVPRWVFRVVG